MHTKRKWVKKNEFTTFSDVKSYIVYGGNFDDIDEQEFVCYCGSHKNSKANATLIASAPELLKSLNHLVILIDDFNSKHDNVLNWPIHIGLAKAAIAAAENANQTTD